jgi:hypothetical protein
MTQSTGTVTVMRWTRRSPPESPPAVLLVPMDTVILRMTSVCDGPILSITLVEPPRRRRPPGQLADILASFAQFQPFNVALVTGNSKLEVRPLGKVT